MKLQHPQSVQDIAQLIDGKYIGDANQLVEGINEIHKVTPGDLVFVDHPKYYDKALNSAATIILIDKEVECPEGKSIIIHEKPFDAYNWLTKHFCPIEDPKAAISEKATIDPSAIVYPNVYIGNYVKIGKNSRIYSGAVIGDRTIIGDNVVIGPNTTLGHNAFYYKRKWEGFDRMHTCGWVQVDDDVEIGANCTIDAGVSGDTKIGKGTKIDNMVHIGHDTVIGEECLFAAQVGLAGCVRIGNKVTLWGQVGCASDVTIGDGVVVLAQSGIGKDLEAGKTYFGSPCGEARDKFREVAALKSLPDLLRKIK